MSLVPDLPGMSVWPPLPATAERVLHVPKPLPDVSSTLLPLGSQYWIPSRWGSGRGSNMERPDVVPGGVLT